MRPVSNHLNRGDYSRWIWESIKEELLAGEVQGNLCESREGIKSAIERYYTAPA